ncbi:Methylenetetrahydrofolate reductase (modular protein) [Frankia sp. AiPs1]
MIDETRAASEDPVFADMPAFRVGAAAGLRPLPTWKRAADFLFVQVSYSVDALLRWRDAHPVELPVYAGVMVLASAGMARRLAATIPDIDIPDDLVQAVERDQAAGVEAACDQVLQLRDSGAFAGVHLVPLSPPPRTGLVWPSPSTPRRAAFTPETSTYSAANASPVH